MTGRAYARLQLIFAAFLLSSGGAAIKSFAFSSLQVASFRAGAAALALWCLAPGVVRRLNGQVFLVGCAYAFTSTTFVLANKLTTSANAIFIQSSAPLYILLVSPWLLREPVRRKDLPLMLAMGCGMALLLLGGSPPSHTAPDPVKGNLVAAGSGIGWGLTLVGLKWLGKTRADSGESGEAAIFCGCMLACLANLPAALPAHGSGLGDWLIAAYLGLFAMALVFRMIASAITRVTALEAGMLLLLEPVLNPLWSWWLLGERPSTMGIVGGGIILAATLLNAVLEEKGGSVGGEVPTSGA